MSLSPASILIAGIGGASLGTEILKCLRIDAAYRVFGCDVSPLAYGLYEAGFADTFLVDRGSYVDSVLQLCSRLGVAAVIPGAEEPAVLLSAAVDRFAKAHVRIAANNSRVAAICADKSKTFSVLAEAGFSVPRTLTADDPAVGEATGPFIVKPVTGSGGSSDVFYARSGDEAAAYATFLTKQRRKAMIQEYVPDDEGEFTVGVLSVPGGRLVGSIALKRLLDPKLSHALRGEGFVVSSGYSQGLIDDFPDVCRMAESIAEAIGSEGPLNVQGRVRDGVFMPFEINARFSASTYLRALAGFNEVALFLEFLLTGKCGVPQELRAGYYLRSLTEAYVPLERIAK